MQLQFTKMHGCGNDYVYVDCFTQTVPDPKALAIQLSDRHKSVGGDGVILICPSDVADAKMRMFNIDGSEGKMCGNGIRCVAEYMFLHGYATGTQTTVETLSGIKLITRKAKGLLTVDMGAPIFAPEQIPLAGVSDVMMNTPAEIGGETVQISCVSMGNPHCVVYVDDTDSYDVEGRGKCFEHHALFPEGVNTEFIQIIDETHLKMRVWERGSGETMACGTGTCAAVAASVQNGYCKKNTDVDVELLGGTLTICYTDETIFMTGNAVVAFEGTVEV